MSSIVPGQGVGYYLERGWKIVSPVRCVCPRCSAALIAPPEGGWAYCVSCDAKVMEEGTARRAGVRWEAPEAGDGEAGRGEAREGGAGGAGEAAREAPRSLAPAGAPESAGAPTSPSAPVPAQPPAPAARGDMEQLLLSGWAMSALSCPRGCAVPLLRDPRAPGHVLCCRCGFESDSAEYAEPAPAVDVAALVSQISARVRAHVAGSGGAGAAGGEDGSEGSEGFEGPGGSGRPGAPSTCQSPTTQAVREAEGRLRARELQLALEAAESPSPEAICAASRAVEALEAIRRVLLSW